MYHYTILHLINHCPISHSDFQCHRCYSLISHAALHLLSYEYYVYVLLREKNETHICMNEDDRAFCTF